MKITCLLLLFACFLQDKPFVSLSDAKKVRGMHARLTTNATKEKDGVIKHDLAFTGTIDTNSHLYVLSAKYTGGAAAHQAYAAIVSANAGMPGQEKLNGIGDEAFFHTDSQHFELLIFRKNDRMVTLKVNRITAKTSVTELRKLAGKIENDL